MSGELDATCNQSGRIVPSASISQTQSNDSALLYKTQDYDSTAATTSLLYKAGSLGAISLFGQYTQTDYPNRVFALSTGAQSDGYSRYAGGVHYERNIGSDIDLGVSVSENSVSTNGGSGKNFSGIGYDGTLTYHPTARLNFNLAVSRQALPSNYLNVDYSIVENYSVEADYRLSARLTATLGAALSHNSFQGAALVSGVDLTSQTLKSFYASLAYKLSPTLSLSLTGGQQQRHADVVGYSYAGAHFGLSVSKAF